jgi:N-acetylglucosaminyldiphosphoundecaprenol N-acetyl-beta-D-mannosaminyltransferase
MMTGQIGCLHFDGTAERQWSVPALQIGGLPIALINRANSAQLMLDAALRRRDSILPPLIFSSANGQVLSMCARHSSIRELFLAADLIHADGMPLVFVSRMLHKPPLPERVCTTDLFHDVARIAPSRRARMFLLGATQKVIDEAARRIRRLYPELDVVGHASGYLRREEDEERAIELINAARPDILWLGLGVPAEQAFALRNRSRLRVGLIKTSGGLFDYISGKTPGRRRGCEVPASNGPSARISNRAVSPDAISRPIRTRYSSCSPALRSAREAISPAN